MGTDVADAVRRYYEVVADLTSTVDDLVPLLHPEGRFIERPNLLAPGGAVRRTDEVVKGFLAGKALLSEQEFIVHEVLVDADRASVRATWTGTVGIDAGPFHRGDTLTAHIAALALIRDGRILEHDTYDCYEPIAAR